MTLAAAPHRELGLTDSEYDGICELLGRDPNALELAVFSLMWSEHCGYKHSRPLLKTLPVVMITAETTRQAVLKALQAGADGFITKPFEPDQLVSAVREVLGLKPG